MSEFLSKNQVWLYLAFMSKLLPKLGNVLHRPCFHSQKANRLPITLPPRMVCTGSNLAWFLRVFQGRNGADGARGIPGEAGPKVEPSLGSSMLTCLLHKMTEHHICFRATEGLTASLVFLEKKGTGWAWGERGGHAVGLQTSLKLQSGTRIRH